MNSICLAALTALLVSCQDAPAPAPVPAPTPSGQFMNPQRIVISGYTGSAEEPFITPDGKFLLFDSRNDFDATSQVYYAQRLTDLTFQFVGPIKELSTKGDVVSLVDTDGWVYFSSTRTFGPPDYNPAYRGKWRGDGTVSDIAPLPGMGSYKPGAFKTVEAGSEDGKTLYLLICTAASQTCDHGVAVRGADGTVTQLGDADPKAVAFRLDFAAVYANPPPGTMISAPHLSADRLEAYFTRNVRSDQTGRILVARRTSTLVPFGAAEVLSTADGFVEGQFLSRDQKHLYYHKAVPSSDGKPRPAIYMLTR